MYTEILNLVTMLNYIFNANCLYLVYILLNFLHKFSDCNDNVFIFLSPDFSFQNQVHVSNL